MSRFTALAPALALTLALFITACGAGDQPGSARLGQAPRLATLPPAQPVTQFKATQVALDQALGDLAALPTPPAADPATFTELKARLAEVLRYIYGGTAEEQLARKAASGTSAAQNSQPWCANAQIAPSGTVTLKWRGRHLGDYDLNGEVNISDLTPLGVFYGQNVTLDADGLPEVAGNNEWKAQVDGDGNTELNITDITPIGVNFASRLTGFRVYYGLDSGAGVQWEPAFIPNAEDAGLPFTLPFSAAIAAGQVLQYALSIDRPVVAPTDHAFVNIVPFDGTAEGPGAILPLPVGPHAPFGCNVCHKLTDYTFRGTATACQGCHTTPPEDAGKVWSNAPGLHNQCLGCHDQHTFTVTAIEPVCAGCHSAIATDVSAGKMTACLACHMAPHVPNATPSPTECATCHAGPAATLADELMQDCSTCHTSHTFTQTYTPELCQGCHANPDNNTSLLWTSAPGQHGTCSACHTLHDFKIADGNALCANCHQDKIDDNHSGGSLDCLSCHGSPHVPLKPGDTNCTACHTTPPGQPDKTWAEAPGLHATCAECHDPATHGAKPTPPESVCTDCHATLMANHAPDGATCISCHNFYHVPEVVSGNAGCMVCHPAPPENPAALWTDVPGLHGECLTCHPGPHPDKPTPPESVCGNCHAAIVTAVAPSGMTQCLGCHQAPHLPLAAPGPTQCQTCHPNPPEQPSANWNDAPGLHNQCAQCHSAHTFSQSWTNTFCRTCHPSGHPALPEEHNQFQCKSCHLRQHVPETQQSIICNICH